MSRLVRPRAWAKVVTACAVVLATALLAACGSGESGTSGGDAKGSGGGDALAAAKAAVAKARERDLNGPDDSARPAVRGKRIAIVTITMANESGAEPAQAVADAAKELGWEAKIYDARTDLAAMTGLVRQAVTTGVDGIVVNAIDCAFAKQAFQEAKQKGVPVVGMNSFDCDDRLSLGGPSDPLFSALVNTSGKSPGEYWLDNGSLVAQAAIADSGNTAKIISVENHELAGLNWMTKGFIDTIDASGGSEIVARVSFNTAEFAAGKVVTLIQSALAEHPEATYVKSPFTAATIGSVVPAVKTAGRDVKLLGGEGLTSELDLLRDGKLAATVANSNEWLGWAAADTLNSVFRKQEPADSGLQWVVIDGTNVPDSGSFEPRADFKAAYRKAWGLG